MNTALWMLPYWFWAERKSYFPQHAVRSRILLAFCDMRMYRLLSVSLLSTRTPRSFSAICFPAVQHPACTGTYSSQVQDLALPPSELHEIPHGSAPQLDKSIWMTSHSSGVASSHSFIPSGKLLNVHSVQRFRSFMNLLNGTGPTIEPWGISLMTCLQMNLMLLITTPWAQLFSSFSVYITIHLSNLQVVSLSVMMALL